MYRFRTRNLILSFASYMKPYPLLPIEFEAAEPRPPSQERSWEGPLPRGFWPSWPLLFTPHSPHLLICLPTFILFSCNNSKMVRVSGGLERAWGHQNGSAVSQGMGLSRAAIGPGRIKGSLTLAFVTIGSRG